MKIRENMLVNGYESDCFLLSNIDENKTQSSICTGEDREEYYMKKILIHNKGTSERSLTNKRTPEEPVTKTTKIRKMDTNLSLLKESTGISEENSTSEQKDISQIEMITDINIISKRADRKVQTQSIIYQAIMNQIEKEQRIVTILNKNDDINQYKPIRYQCPISARQMSDQCHTNVRQMSIRK